MVGDFFLRLKFLIVYLLHLLSEYVFKIVASEAGILGTNRFRVTSPSNSWIIWGHENNLEKLREFVWGIDAREMQAPHQESCVLAIDDFIWQGCSFFLVKWTAISLSSTLVYIKPCHGGSSCPILQVSGGSSTRSPSESLVFWHVSSLIKRCFGSEHRHFELLRKHGPLSTPGETGNRSLRVVKRELAHER